MGTGPSKKRREQDREQESKLERHIVLDRLWEAVDEDNSGEIERMEMTVVTQALLHIQSATCDMAYSWLEKKGDLTTDGIMPKSF